MLCFPLLVVVKTLRKSSVNIIFSRQSTLHDVSSCIQIVEIFHCLSSKSGRRINNEFERSIARCRCISQCNLFSQACILQHKKSASENYRMEIERCLCRWSNLVSLLKLRTPRAGCSGLCPLAFWMCPRMETPHLSGKPVSLFDQSEENKVFFLCLNLKRLSYF